MGILSHFFSTAPKNPDVIMQPRSARVQCSPNIALVKYWGKRDVASNSPVNGSISIGMADCHTVTEVELFPSTRPSVHFTLNGTVCDPPSRLPALLDCFRAVLPVDHGKTVLDRSTLTISSTNDFPTGAGLASSASGLAAIAVALNVALDAPFSDDALAMVAKVGSGSAGRSIHGGFVQWSVDPAEAIEQVAPASHWPELRLLLVEAAADTKKVGSTAGMLRSAATCPFMAARAASAAARLTRVRQAVLDRDFAIVAEEAMADSNELHAVCLASRPAIVYLSGASLAVMGAIHDLNAAAGHTIAGYTFDAGPHAVVLTTAEHAKRVEWRLRELMIDIDAAVGVRDVRPMAIGGQYTVLE